MLCARVSAEVLNTSTFSSILVFIIPWCLEFVVISLLIFFRWLSYFSGVQRSAFHVSREQYVKQEDSTSVDPGHIVMEPVGGGFLV